MRHTEVEGRPISAAAQSTSDSPMVDHVKARPDGRPVWVGELDIAAPDGVAANKPAVNKPSATTDISGVDHQDPSVGPDGTPYTIGRILIRCQGEPLGMVTVELPDGSLDRAAVRAEAAERFADDIARIAGRNWAAADQLPPLSSELRSLSTAELPAVSIVIGTRNRPDQVVTCVELVLAQDYPSPLEVIIVDNGAASSATADAVAAAFGSDERVRYLAESRPGLSRARNLGLEAARHPVTAFLSDDIRVDPLWLLAVGRGFARDDAVHCVTGFCPPMYLDTPEQLMFESSMAWGTRQGFEPVLYRYVLAEDPVHPYRAGKFVNGSNMVYDTEVFRSMGGFDETLGPGTKARGGEDLDAPIRILAGGGLVAFEPAVIGWHADRYEDRSFSRHMYTYGLGLTAFLAKHLIDKEHRRNVIVRMSKGFPLLLNAFAERDEVLSDDVPVPTKYHLAHLAGRIAGPFAYLRSRWSTKQQNNQ